MLLTWRHLLEGATPPFEVWTDHKNLEALQTPRRMSPQQVRWAQYFSRFKFTLKYVPAGCNFLADTLSRMPQYDSKREETIQAIIPSAQTAGQVSPDRTTNLWHNLVTQALMTDQWVQNNRTLITTRDSLAWWNDKLYIPEMVRMKVLKECHDVKPAGHFGFLKTLHLTRRQF